MGNVYYQQQQWKEAIKYFDKSLTEHRNADVLKKKQLVRDVCVCACVCMRACVRACMHASVLCVRARAHKCVMELLIAIATISMYPPHC